MNIKPMLAHDYKVHGHKLPEDLVFQEKLNGIRALYKDGIFYSRELKVLPFKLPYKLQVEDSFIIDGELVLPKEYKLADVNSAVKASNDLTSRVNYIAFDLISVNDNKLVDITFEDRYKLLQSVFAQGEKHNICPVRNAKKEVIDSILEGFVSQGSEGIMLRDKNSPYESKRSFYLQKYKPTYDAEYKLVGVVEGKGKFTSMPIFIFETPEGLNFSAVPEGSFERKRELWLDRSNLIGQIWNVEYAELSKDNIPLQPRAVYRREEL